MPNDPFFSNLVTSKIHIRSNRTVEIVIAPSGCFRQRADGRLFETGNACLRCGATMAGVLSVSEYGLGKRHCTNPQKQSGSGCEVIDLDEIAAGIVENGEGEGAIHGWLGRELDAERCEPLEFRVDVIDGECRERYTLFDERRLVCPGDRILVRFQGQLDAIRLVGGDDGQPSELPCGEFRLFHETEYHRVEGQGLGLIVDDDAGELNLHGGHPMPGWLKAQGQVLGMPGSTPIGRSSPEPKGRGESEKPTIGAERKSEGSAYPPWSGAGWRWNGSVKLKRGVIVVRS